MSIGLFSLIYKTFFQPQIFIDLKNEKRWWKGFLALFLTMWITSFIVFLVERPLMSERINAFVNWFSEELSAIELVDGKLKFISEKSFPIITEKNGIKIAIYDDETRFSVNDFINENIGIFLSQKEGFLVANQVSKNSVVPIYANGQIGNKNLSIEQLFKQFDTAKFKTENLKKLTSFMIFIVFAYILLSNFISAIFILLALIIMNRLLRSPLFNDYTFGQLLSFYCFVGILPAIFAIIYSSPMIEFGSFFMIFVCIFMIQFFFRVVRFIIPPNLLNIDKT